MSQQHTRVGLSQVGYACVLALSLFNLQFASSHTQTFDEPLPEESLQEFAVSSSLPRRGINIISLTSQPIYSAFWLIRSARYDSDVSAALNLRVDQNTAVEKFLSFVHDEIDHTVDLADHHFDLYSLRDESADPELYSFLDANQRHFVELVGLRLDGCSALVRTYWVARLDLDPHQVEAMQARATDIRKNKVAARLRRSFGGITPEPERLLLWEATTDAVSYNLWAISILSDSQKTELKKALAESAKYDSIVQKETKQSFVDGPRKITLND